MITIILEHASDALKGELAKWITVVKPGVYVGNINGRTRELLISKIQNEYDDLKNTALYLSANPSVIPSMLGPSK